MYQWHMIWCAHRHVIVCVFLCGCVVTIFMYYLAPFLQILDHFAWQYLVWWPLSDIINCIDVPDWWVIVTTCNSFFTLAIFFSPVQQFSSDLSVVECNFLQHRMQIVFSVINRPLPCGPVISYHHHLTLQLFFNSIIASFALIQFSFHHFLGCNLIFS